MPDDFVNSYCLANRSVDRETTSTVIQRNREASDTLHAEKRKTLPGNEIILPRYTMTPIINKT